MTDLSLAPPISLFDRIVQVLGRPFKTAAATEDPEDARKRRAFIMEKIEQNPDAFASAYDVHAMMSLYPRSY